MRLTKVTLWNFRSFWSKDALGDQVESPSAAIDLSPGVNYLVGPNNVGKSNLLRAIALALDPHAAYQQIVDRPQTKTSGPAIELEFAVTLPADGSVKKLLDAVDAYERAIKGFNEPSLASQGVVRFFVEYSNGGVRDERFLTHGAYERGDVVGRNNKRQKAVEHFHEVVRFVDIKSGEDLQSLLRRGFKEILASAMGAELTKEMTHARDARTAYFEALRQVLRPVAKHVENRIKGYVPAIHEVDLMPNVPSVEDALADVQVYIEDAARTALDQKGTGVRGAMLLLLLSFIADSANSAVVFGIEEPEAFLHPEAHRILGEGLERFTQREDVTLLATTHSPFVLRSDAGDDDERSAVFVVRKDEFGRSSVAKGGVDSARMDLLGSRLLTSLLQRGDEVPEKAKLVLVVEGWTDRRYLEIAAQRLGIRLDAVHIVAAGGSIAAAVQAEMLKAMHHPERLVVALFDGDEEGRTGQKILVSKFKWKNKTEALCYDQWINADNVAVEAEDLFGKDVIDAFLKEPGHDVFFDELQRRPTTKGWHCGLTKDGKPAFVTWIEKQTDVALFEKWREPLWHILKLIGDAETRAANKAAVEAAQAAAGMKPSPTTAAADE